MCQKFSKIQIPKNFPKTSQKSPKNFPKIGSLFSGEEKCGFPQSKKRKNNNFAQFIFPKTDFQKTYMSQGKPKYPHFSQKGQIRISSIDFPIFSHFVQFSSHAFPIISIQFLALFFPILFQSFLMRFSSPRNFLTRYDEKSIAFPILSMESHRIFLLIGKGLLLK